MTDRAKRAAPRSRAAKKPPVITLEELMRRLADPDEPEANILPYLTAKRDRRFGLAPVLLPNDNVDEEATPAARVRGDIGLGFLNAVYQSRRRRRFERRLRRRDPAPVLLAEGDSWFQYPAFLHDVIDHLEDDHNIFCLSAAGDELRAMIAQPEYRDHLDYLARARGVRFAAFLFSAGGNDIVGDAMPPLLRDYDPAKPGSWHVNPTAFRAKMREVSEGYRSVVQTVRKLQPKLPILLHGYDYALPLPKQGFSVPPRDGWLGEPLRARGVPDGPVGAR